MTECERVRGSSAWQGCACACACACAPSCRGVLLGRFNSARPLCGTCCRLIFVCVFVRVCVYGMHPLKWSAANEAFSADVEESVVFGNIGDDDL